MVFWLLIFIFFLSRLYHLTVMPPFMDELIYMRWLNDIRTGGNWLVPLTEFGWEPLQIWLAALLNRLVADPILSLRLTGVLIGGAITALIYRLAGKTAAALYLLSPLVLLHDRLGLRGDNLVVLAALLVYWGLKKTRALIWGAGIAIGLMAKTTAAALPVVVIVSYLWLKRRPRWPEAAALFLAAIPVIFYYFSGTLPAVVAKQSTFVGDFLIKNNLIQIGSWLYQYLTWPVALLVIVGAAASKNRLLLINALVPLVLLIASAKILFPRYLLPAMPFILMAAAAGLNWLKRNLPRPLKLWLFVFFLAPAWFCRQILNDTATAPLAEIDRWQYVTGWPSGYGVKELTEYLQINDLGPLLNYSTEELLTDKIISNEYAITNINHTEVDGELIKEFARPGNKSSLKLWHLK